MRVARRRDHVEVQRLHLAHARAAVRRLGARDADSDVAQRRLHGRRPRRDRRVRRAAPEHSLLRPRRIERFARRTAPALAQQVTQRARSRTFDGHHQVVKRRVRRTAHHAVRALRQVLACIPAARSQVDAAAECHCVVDDHDLLVMAAADRMRVVVAEADPAMRLPRQAVQRRPFAIEPEDHRVIPDQDVDLQLAALPHQLVEKAAELQLAVLAVRTQQARAAVEIPAGDQDRAARVARRLDECLEIRVRIDEEARPRGVLDAPAITTDREQFRPLHIFFRRHASQNACGGPGVPLSDRPC